MRAWVRRLLAGWDHKARWNGPMAFVPRLKVAFISWLLDCATWGCCVSGFVELFGSRVISRDTPQISDLQNPDFVQIVLLKYSELNWKILEATNCREPYPLTAHWTCIERSWERSCGSHLRPRKVWMLRRAAICGSCQWHQEVQRLLDHGIFWRSKILWSKLINPSSGYLIRTPLHATSQAFDHRHPDFEAVHGHSLRQFLLRHGGLLPKLQARCTSSRCSPSCRL